MSLLLLNWHFKMQMTNAKCSIWDKLNSTQGPPCIFFTAFNQRLLLAKSKRTFNWNCFFHKRDILTANAWKSAKCEMKNKALSLWWKNKTLSKVILLGNDGSLPKVMRFKIFSRVDALKESRLEIWGISTQLEWHTVQNKRLFLHVALI